jgi:hypothetical protein
MISRLTASAVIFAVLATAGFAVAADARPGSAGARVGKAEPMQVFVLPRVEVIGKRRPAR